MTVWLIRYSEIFLKSDYVRREWEKRLIDNIGAVLPSAHAASERGRIWLSGDVDPEQLRNIFGIVSFSPCVTCTIADLESTLLVFCKDIHLDAIQSFALRIKRVGSHPFSSQQLAETLGSLILTTYPHVKVDLTNPEKEIGIEVRENSCYLFDTIIPGPSGIPLGVEGTLVALISGGIDSPVAAYLMMKRGCTIIPLYVSLDGFLDDTVLVRAEKVVESLERYQPGIRLRVVKDSYLIKVKEELVKERAEKYTCILCKRRMYRIAEAICRQVGAKGIVTGESLGQVASQTLDNLLVLNSAVAVPIYRPLIGFDKEEIVRRAREIGTYKVSTSRTSGCRAVPNKPATAAQLERVLAIEKKLMESGIQITSDLN